MLSINRPDGQVHNLEVERGQNIASVKQALAGELVVVEGTLLELICGEKRLLDTDLVDDLASPDLLVMRTFTSCLCQIDVNGEFPADPRDFCPADSIAKWPNVTPCKGSEEERLGALLTQKTAVDISASRANLKESGLQPDPAMVIAQIMSCVQAVERLCLDKGSEFVLSLESVREMNLLGVDGQSLLLDLGLVSGSKADLVDEEEELPSESSWRTTGESNIICMNFILALEILEEVRPSVATGTCFVLRQLTAEGIAMSAGAADLDIPESGRCTFWTFRQLFGERALAVWEAAGPADEAEEQAVSESRQILALAEARLQSIPFEAYTLRFDFEGVDSGLDGKGRADLYFLLRWMAWGMSSTSGSYTLAHHCDIEATGPGTVRVTMQALGHPASANKRKGFFRRTQQWWRTRILDDHQNKGSWNMVWRFSQHLRELSCGGLRGADRIKLRWRTICKLIRSQTLRRCGIPASSQSSENRDELPYGCKFYFFRGSDVLVSAKRQLLVDLRCRRVGFSRAPATAKASPYAVDVSFGGRAGAPLAWMWALNMKGGADLPCMATEDETSAKEFYAELEQAASADTWPTAPEELSGALPPDRWPRFQIFQEFIDSANADTDNSD